MGCGSSLAKRNAAADDRVGNYIVEDDHLGRKCGKCEGLCILKISESGACALCGADSAGAWCCRAGCGFLVCVLCELHLAMMGDSVHRLRVALLAFKDLDSASTREAMAILEAFAALEAATETDEVQQLQSALAVAHGFNVPFVQHKVAELAAVLEEWEAVKLRLEASIEGSSVQLLTQNVEDAAALKLQMPETIQHARERINQLQALERLENVMAAIAIALAEEQPVALDELRTCIAAAREARSSPELNEALGRAEPLLEKQSAAERVDLALDAWDRNALQEAVAEASRVGALRESVLRTAQAELAKMEVMCTAGHHLRRSREFRDACCYGCYAESRAKELLWYRCDLCDFDLCHHCLQWRAKSDADKSSLPEQDPAIREGRAETSTFSRVETQRLRLGRLANEQSQRDWFNEWAAKNSAINAQWELFRGGCWVPCGRGLTNWLAEALQSGVKQALYTAMNHQEHLFDFKQMEQVIVSSGKRRPMRRVLWEVELDIGWFQVEDDLALRLRTQESCGASSFKYSARDMQYTIDIKEMEQVNENLGTRRKLRKVAVGEAPPKMSRHQLRMALEDDFRDFAYSTRQWLALRWPWQVLGDCSIDADGFIETGLADDIASGLDTLQREMPQLGSIMQNIIWFDYVDGDKKGSLSQVQVVDAIVRDPRWRWAHAGAEDACSALWAELCLKGGIEKLEFLVAGGLAEELLEILNSDIESVDDWIMEKRLPLWEGQDCAVCFCPIGKGDVGRRMRCSCWLHFECLGRGLGVKISEKAVDDEQMSICPACNTDLGRIIPPGVVHRAVGDDIFARYLDLRVEVQWQKEALDSGRLVAKCPSCSFLVLCNTQEDACHAVVFDLERGAEMIAIKCLRPTCPVERFCAMCSLPEHRPWTCHENEMRMKCADSSEFVRIQIEEALAQALYRKCTGCGVPTERIDACCHMTCSHCRAEFSWICGADYHLCRSSHPCLNGSIYLHSMPQLAAILDQRGLPRSDENGSDLFLELRCLYLLSQLKRRVGEDAWTYAREHFSEVLNDVIRGHWSIRWSDIGNVERLTALLPMAFPPLTDQL